MLLARVLQEPTCVSGETSVDAANSAIGKLEFVIILGLISVAEPCAYVILLIN